MPSETSPSRVGVFVPTYNGAGTLKRALDSILAQTHSDLVVLVLDDCSTDDTESVVAPYLRDERVRYRRNQRNLGMYRNFNEGLRLLDTPFVAKVDADDHVHPTWLETAVSALRGSRTAGLFFSAIVKERHDGEQEVSRPFTEAGLLRSAELLPVLLRTNCVPSQSVVLRRQVVDDLGGFEEDLTVYSDYEYRVRIVSHWDAVYSPHPLATYVLHERNATTLAAGYAEIAIFASRWLDAIAAGRTKYELSEGDLLGLEANLMLRVWGAFHRLLRARRWKEAKACALTLRRARCIPLWARIQIATAGRLAVYVGGMSQQLLRGLERFGGMRQLHARNRASLPARSPADALHVADSISREGYAGFSKWNPSSR